jgi:hypothetical protein
VHLYPIYINGGCKQDRHNELLFLKISPFPTPPAKKAGCSPLLPPLANSLPFPWPSRKCPRPESIWRPPRRKDGPQHRRKTNRPRRSRIRKRKPTNPPQRRGKRLPQAKEVKTPSRFPSRRPHAQKRRRPLEAQSCWAQRNPLPLQSGVTRLRLTPCSTECWKP